LDIEDPHTIPTIITNLSIRNNAQQESLQNTIDQIKKVQSDFVQQQQALTLL